MGVFSNMSIDRDEYDKEEVEYQKKQENIEKWIRYILEKCPEKYSYLSLCNLSYESLRGLYASLNKDRDDEFYDSIGSRGR